MTITGDTYEGLDVERGPLEEAYAVHLPDQGRLILDDQATDAELAAAVAALNLTDARQPQARPAVTGILARLPGPRVPSDP